MKALVTGGGGFLGQAIVRKLVEQGDSVRILARSDYPELRTLGVETFRGNLADMSSIRDAAKGCDVVFHVAAKAGVWGPYYEYHRVNVEGTRNVIETCRDKSTCMCYNAQSEIRLLIHVTTYVITFNI